MFQRRKLILLRIQMLLSEIYQRHKLKEENLYHISIDQCTFRNLIYLLGDDVDARDKCKIDLERKIMDLEQEKRKEQTSHFRDVLFLRKELREALIENVEEEQKAGLLTNHEEGSA